MTGVGPDAPMVEARAHVEAVGRLQVAIELRGRGSAVPSRLRAFYSPVKFGFRFSRNAFTASR